MVYYCKKKLNYFQKLSTLNNILNNRTLTLFFCLFIILVFLISPYPTTLKTYILNSLKCVKVYEMHETTYHSPAFLILYSTITTCQILYHSLILVTRVLAQAQIYTLILYYFPLHSIISLKARFKIHTKCGHYLISLYLKIILLKHFC